MNKGRSPTTHVYSSKYTGFSRGATMILSLETQTVTRNRAAANSIEMRTDFDRLMNPLTLSSTAVLVAGLLIQAPSMAQTTQRQKIDVSKLGPQVGERVPDFSLLDQNGKTQTLQSIMGPKGAMLVFIRSADW
jgi:hypothetical protein